MTRRKRRKPRKKKPAAALRALLPKLPGGSMMRLGAVLLGFVVGINGVVRHVGGGAVHPLSLSRMADKTRAVGMLAAHLALHPFSEDEEDPAEVVKQAAQAEGISPWLALQVARTESSLHPHAISHTGAMGLMQLMPETARAYGADDPFDVADNAGAASRFLKDLLRRYGGDRRRVLAAYNAGPGRVPRSGPYDLPAETRAYVAKILE